MHDELVKRLRDAAKKEPKWIPVTERLPEIGTYIIAGRMKYYYEKAYTNFVDVAYFGPRWNDTDYSWQTFNDWFEGQQEFEITHWMPLPEPPDHIGEATEMVEKEGKKWT